MRAAIVEDGLLTRYGAAWQLDVVQSWRQVFPARSHTRLEASLAPVTGSYVDTLLRMMGEIAIGINGYPLSELCLSAAQRAEIERVFATIPADDYERPYVQIRTAGLELLDMDSYAGGIHDFRMIVTPDDPHDIVSVCGGDFEPAGDGSGAVVWETGREEPQSLRIFFIERDPEYRDR